MEIQEIVKRNITTFDSETGEVIDVEIAVDVRALMLELSELMEPNLALVARTFGIHQDQRLKRLKQWTRKVIE